MSSQKYQNNDRREQEQLEIIRAQIEDATKDTIRWLQDDPSAEERVHVLAIQTGLANLARIIERRMERRKLPKDEWEYSETVNEVLSRLDKARKLRGNIIVGKGLGRLTEPLPQELPGSRPRLISKLPAPITPLRGSGIASYRPKASQIPADLPPCYPNDLKPQTHVTIAEAVRKFPGQTHALELCRYVISDLTPHFRAAVQCKTLPADLVFPNMCELLHYLLVSNCDREDERFRLAQETRKSDEWLRLAREIAEVSAEPSFDNVESKSARSDPEVAKRVALVKANPGDPAAEMCETFDRENVPLPAKWLDAGLQNWSRAYKNSDYRSRIYTLISKDRAR